ncbi:hypothetical protein HPB49_015715 [Dermacentor silvarum]|uniref:Uncharacterized protein n=1 Tax=Dermacentor silvarum TaxID=543639 RepID=A0ACB8CY36_DERSI|nr:hypothetical protein HPB49_015715 [Dermacentor silvarum]
MVQSLTCKFKEVAHILPILGADANLLELLKDVICWLEKIGYKVICVVTDNNKVNGKATEKFYNSVPCLGDNHPTFLYPHPCSAERLFFLIIDTVHLLKCIRYNWLRQRNDQHCFSFPDFHEGMAQQRLMLSASFDPLRDVYDIELGQLLRHAYTLSRNGLFPSDLEKQNVKLALQVFTDTVSPTLRVITVKHTLNHVEGTASFLKIVVKWWKIVNVRTACKGTRRKTSKDAESMNLC